MKKICFFLVLLSLFSSRYCIGQEVIVIADKLTRDDVENALLSGEITSNCTLGGHPEYGSTSLNPGTLIVKGIYHHNDKATIHFMGKIKGTVNPDEMPVVCEADLERLESGEWLDPVNGSKLKK